MKVCKERKKQKNSCMDACTYQNLRYKTRLVQGSEDVVQKTSGQQHKSNLGCKVRKVEKQDVFTFPYIIGI